MVVHKLPYSESLRASSTRLRASEHQKMFRSHSSHLALDSGKINHVYGKQTNHTQLELMRLRRDCLERLGLRFNLLSEQLVQNFECDLPSLGNTESVNSMSPNAEDIAFT
ncbi:hypothetical protein E1B28_009405 [Marasmius oreades]|uniref:Uncharacterized protein n=1 Tax=Marasmius oreades TaxID=181124 RepID=A0A9P7S0M1_9AGAR|nr:uncharacterized protein E1B28_009405 [Marasmius oreades]KAG7093120.1 hypothetical protein E1B28_009405 [Marasmius oreades]